jgi:hypothetical protein
MLLLLLLCAVPPIDGRHQQQQQSRDVHLSGTFATEHSNISLMVVVLLKC